MAWNSFFSRSKSLAPDPAVATWSTMAMFYCLVIFLIAIPFLLIISLVWLNNLLSFGIYIFAGVTLLCLAALWRLHRSWRDLKARIAAQGSEFGDLMRDAARSGQNMEISLLSGLFTVRYQGSDLALPQAQPPPLALESPFDLEGGAEGSPALLPSQRLRQELEEYGRLRESGLITPEEYDRVKAILLRKISA